MRLVLRKGANLGGAVGLGGGRAGAEMVGRGGVTKLGAGADGDVGSEEGACGGEF